MKILVVDDDLFTLRSIEHNLRGEGYEVSVSEDGFSALEILQKEKIDLIICDIMMPNLSGLGFLNLLKQFYLNRIPVIVISSLDKADVILCTMGLGANDFIVKPINFEELSIRIKKHLYTSPSPSKNL